MSRLSGIIKKLICGLSPATAGEEKRARPSMVSPAGGGWPISMATATGETMEDLLADEEEMAAAVPCVAFGSVDGYKVFDFGENRMRDDGGVRLRLVRGRRHVSSPHGGRVFATDMCGRHRSHLVEPFTGERTPLPDLPVPFSEEEPMPYDPGEPRSRLSTDDKFAWDWSPHGVMVARGDTVFFSEAAGGGGEWRPVHRSRRNSRMTVNYRDGFFFVLELRSLVTTVIRAGTLDRWAEIEPPPGIDDIDMAFLVASADDVLLLVHCASNDGEPHDGLLSQAFRAHHRSPLPKWEPVTDIGDRAAFVDGAHGFTVRAGERAQRNHVYMLVPMAVDGPPRRSGAIVHVVGVAPLNNLSKVAFEEESELTASRSQPTWGAAHWFTADHRHPSRRCISNY